MSQTVSVVSAVRNRADNVQRWLESLALQTIPLEVVLVDFASTDHLEQVLQTSPVEVKCVHMPFRESLDGFPEGQLKNVGIRRSTGDIVVCTNNDVVYEPTFFEHIEKCCIPMMFIMGMRINPPPDAHIATNGQITFGERRDVSMVNDFGYGMMGAPIVAGGDCQAMLREHWEEFRGYDEEIVGWGSVDSDMTCRALLHGMSLLIMGHKILHFAHPWHPVDHEKNRIDAERNHTATMQKTYQGIWQRNPDHWGETT